MALSWRVLLPVVSLIQGADLARESREYLVSVGMEVALTKPYKRNLVHSSLKPSTDNRAGLDLVISIICPTKLDNLLPSFDAAHEVEKLRGPAHKRIFLPHTCNTTMKMMAAAQIPP